MLRSSVFYLLLHSVRAFAFFPLEQPRRAPRSALETSSSDYSVSDTQRRVIFASFISTGLAAALFSGGQRAQQALSPLKTTETITFIENVDQALEWIDAACDRRFLHAVVASDYKLLYKGLPSSAEERISLCSTPEDLLRGQDATFFQTLEEQLQKQPIQPSISRIAVANPVAAQRMGSTVCSVWPLGNNVHFAWLENGTSFRGTWDTKMIVDGVDCGRMSLEDALEGNKEILFRSERYLAVPLSMEQELVQTLKNSFII